MRVRKQFRLEPRQDRDLKRLARRVGKSESEILRETLDRHFEQSIAKGPATPGKRWIRDEIHQR